MVDISWPVVAFFWGIICASFGFSWIVNRNASEGDKRLHERMDQHIERDTAYRERVAREYFQKIDAKGLETRIETGMAKLNDKFDALMNKLMGGLK